LSKPTWILVMTAVSIKTSLFSPRETRDNYRIALMKQ
jgi:hypothetical protein